MRYGHCFILWDQDSCQIHLRARDQRFPYFMLSSAAGNWLPQICACNLVGMEPRKKHVSLSSSGGIEFSSSICHCSCCPPGPNTPYGLLDPLCASLYPSCLPLPFLPVKVLPLTSRITYHQPLYVVVFWASVPAPHPLHWHRGGSMAPKTVYTINLHNLLFIKKLFTQCVILKKKNKMPVIICVNSKRNWKPICTDFSKICSLFMGCLCGHTQLWGEVWDLLIAFSFWMFFTHNVHSSNSQLIGTV